LSVFRNQVKRRGPARAREKAAKKLDPAHAKEKLHAYRLSLSVSPPRINAAGRPIMDMPPIFVVELVPPRRTRDQSRSACKETGLFFF